MSRNRDDDPQRILAERAREERAAAIGAGGALLEDRVATGNSSRIGPLLLGGDPRVADQAAGEGASVRFRRHLAELSRC